MSWKIGTVPNEIQGMNNKVVELYGWVNVREHTESNT